MHAHDLSQGGSEGGLLDMFQYVGITVRVFLENGFILRG